MPSVDPIPFNEPRKQPANRPQPSGGDPFAELLASTAREEPQPRREPAAPKSRGETRTENLSRKDVKEAKSVPARRETARKPAETDGETEIAAESGAETAPANAQSNDTEAETNEAPVVAEATEEIAAPQAAAEGEETEGETEIPDTAAVVENAPVNVVDAAPADSDAATAPMPTTATPTVAPVAEETVAATTEVAAAPVEDAPTAPRPEQATGPAAPAAPAAKENAAAPTPAAAAQDAKPSDAKPAHAAVPATPATTEPGEGVTIPATPATPATPANKPAQAQGAPVAGQQPQTQAAVTDFSSSLQGEGDDASPQKQPDTSANQAKPQDVKHATAAEAKPAPAQDIPAPKVQPQVLPEAVRAVTNSLNPANVQTVNFHATVVNDRAPVPLNNTALAVEIVSRMNEGMRRFDIRLDPPELGRVDVRLEVDRNGNVTTKLTVDRPETLDLMQRDARHLERALQQAGLKTDGGGGLEFSLRSHADQGGMAGGHAGRSGREHGMTGGDDVERVELSVEAYRSAALARGGVDIRI